MPYDYPDWYLAFTPEQREAHDRAMAEQRKAAAIADGTYRAPDGRDLETIVTLLELAAIELSDAPGKRFTFDALMAEARRYGGDEIELRECDVALVLPGMRSEIRPAGRNHYVLV